MIVALQSLRIFAYRYLENFGEADRCVSVGLTAPISAAGSLVATLSRSAPHVRKKPPR
jgi:hypothetical protein